MDKNTQNLLTKEVKPPYLSLTTLEKLFGLLSTRRLDEIKNPYLEAQGFTKFDIGVIPSTLKFLGLIDDNFKTSEIVKKLHLQGDPKKEALQSIVKNGYKRLFNTIDNPYEMPATELKNEFIATYDISSRIAGAAMPAFLWLCEEAGLKEKSILPRKRLNTKTGPQNNKMEKSNHKPMIPEQNLPISSTSKLDIIKEFVVKINPESIDDVEKIKTVSVIIKELLETIPDPVSPNETKTDSSVRTA